MTAIRPARTETFEHSISGLLTHRADLYAAMPRPKCKAIFGRREMSGTMFEELRNASGPHTGREIAHSVVALRGDDARDREYLPDLTKQGSKALRGMRDDGNVRSFLAASGLLVWRGRQQTATMV